ncbi:hypothetical protein JKP88DRAFT_268395 [Tribonema minus]|uniref:Uncharacterized protein n=1 Tax=Tribonema minus TaxID=303371 RepID=A0A835Z0E6_9STRA|nr:hypothetical protein JKP88DRAFT_268395 [Tribonema minus]
MSRTQRALSAGDDAPAGAWHQRHHSTAAAAAAAAEAGAAADAAEAAAAAAAHRGALSLDVELAHSWSDTQRHWRSAPPSAASSADARSHPRAPPPSAPAAPPHPHLSPLLTAALPPAQLELATATTSSASPTSPPPSAADVSAASAFKLPSGLVEGDVSEESAQVPQAFDHRHSIRRGGRRSKERHRQRLAVWEAIAAVTGEYPVRKQPYQEQAWVRIWGLTDATPEYVLTLVERACGEGKAPLRVHVDARCAAAVVLMPSKTQAARLRFRLNKWTSAQGGCGPHAGPCEPPPGAASAVAAAGGGGSGGIASAAPAVLSNGAGPSWMPPPPTMAGWRHGVSSGSGGGGGGGSHFGDGIDG